MATHIGIWETKLGVGLEGTYGVLGSIGRYINTEDMTIDFQRDSVVKETYGVERANKFTYKREEIVTPSITTHAEPNHITEILAIHFGASPSATENLGGASGTQYKRTFSPIGTITDGWASATFKLDYGQGTVDDITGIRGNSLSIGVVSKEEMKITMEGIGKTRAVGTSCPVTISYGTFNPFLFSDVSVKIDGTVVTGIHNLTLDLNNNMTEGFRVNNERSTTRPLAGGKYEANVKFDIEYNGVDRERYLTGSYIGVEITAQSDVIVGTGKNEMKIRLPKVNYMTSPVGEAEGLRILSVDGVCLEGGTSNAGTGRAVIVDLFNTVKTI